MASIIDVHTHIYPLPYLALLKARTSIPYIRTSPDDPSRPRLVILPDEAGSASGGALQGRPLNSGFYDIKQKIAFMDAHGIDISILSLANPWLDFVDPDVAAETARTINDNIDDTCDGHQGRLFAFATLPLSATPAEIVAELERVVSLRWMRGVIIGTNGLGNGLDDQAMDPIYEALQRLDIVTFVHPHYGLPASVYGPREGEYGHVLPLALGFPMETTIAIARMYLSGVFDRFPTLRLLLAHSGGTIPFLAGRIEGCIEHDGLLFQEGRKPRRKLIEILKTTVYLDAVVYSEAGVKAAIETSSPDRVMFGRFKTEH